MSIIVPITNWVTPSSQKFFGGYFYRKPFERKPFQVWGPSPDCSPSARLITIITSECYSCGWNRDFWYWIKISYFLVKIITIFSFYFSLKIISFSITWSRGISMFWCFQTYFWLKNSNGLISFSIFTICCWREKNFL